MRPLVVGIGGTPRPASSTELALRASLAAAERRGARTLMFDGAFLSSLPLYLTPEAVLSRKASELIAAVREARGIILASPGYHGSVSGLVKNAIDYFEATARDGRAYLDGVPVGLIATAYGWQATGSTLATMRSIVHALRGWPTPLGAAINSAGGIFENGECTDHAMASQLDLVGRQVAAFAAITLVDPAITETAQD